MLHKTKGIVFRFTRFRETSIIATIFTETFGLQSYMVNGVRSKSAKSNKIALFQPLTLLNLVVYHRERANIERISEMQCFYPYQSLTADVRKATVAMFITELLNKTVKEESHAREMFAFLSESLIAIDKMTKGYENAHLILLIQLSRNLGFGPQFANEVLGGRVTDQETENALTILLSADFKDPVHLSNTQRRNALDLIIAYYRDHIENLGEFRSVAVLREVFNS